jgi:hypothetical protein
MAKPFPPRLDHAYLEDVRQRAKEMRLGAVAVRVATAELLSAARGMAPPARLDVEPAVGEQIEAILRTLTADGQRHDALTVRPSRVIVWEAPHWRFRRAPIPHRSRRGPKSAKR